MTTRSEVEFRGKAGRGIVEETKDWNMVRILGSIPIYCRKTDESVTPCLVKDGYWESWITAWVMNNVDEDTLFVDVGANTGYYSFVARKQGAHVMAFEPNPDYVEMIKASINIGWSQSRGDWLPANHFTVMPWAVSDKKGAVTLSIPGHYEGSASITTGFAETDYSVRTLEASSVSLDNVLGGIYPFDKTVIKVDAEGAEELIWNGSMMTRYTLNPTFMLEYTPGAYTRDFLDKLEDYGDLAWINHDGVEEKIDQNTIIANGDWLMLLIRPRK